VNPYYEDAESGITIYHARCEDVLPSINPATVDLLLTDPPYGLALDTDYSRLKGSTRTYARIIGDEAPFDPAPLLRFARLVLWGANHYASRLPDSPTWLVWDKRGDQMPNIFSDVEVAWTNLGGPARRFAHLWNVNRASERGYHVHPTQKPVALMQWIIERWTEPGDLILDPYMGSGPIARACQLASRKYIGIELVEDYCRIAVNRLAQSPLFAEAT